MGDPGSGKRETSWKKASASPWKLSSPARRVDSAGVFGLVSGGVLHLYGFDRRGVPGLDQNNGNVWTSKEGVYLSTMPTRGGCTSTTARSGNMGAEGAGTEFDAGSLFPTLMQDTYRNQIKTPIAAA